MNTLNALGVFSSDVATGNLVWVDAVNGNDALAQRGRMTIPFRTLGGAKIAAQIGDTIIVLPGTYSEKNLLKHLVNWHFLPGAKVNYAGAVAGAIFDTTTANGTGGAVTSSVAGHGEFVISAATGTSHVLICDTGTSNLSIQARSMQSNNTAIKVLDGTCQVQLSEDVVAVVADVILANGGFLNVYARDLGSSGGCCLRVQSGSGIVDIFARTLFTAADHGVSIEGGSGAATIRAYEVRAGSTNKYGLYYNNASGGVLTMLGTRIRTTWSGMGAYAAYIASSSNDKVKLANCILIAGATATASLAAVSLGTRVHILNGAAANVAFTNITQVGGTLNAADPTIS